MPLQLRLSYDIVVAGIEFFSLPTGADLLIAGALTKAFNQTLLRASYVCDVCGVLLCICVIHVHSTLHA